MARPRSTVKRSLVLPPIRVSESEKRQIGEEAEKAGLSVSEFVRRRLLGIRIIAQADDKVLNELRRLGGLQKHLAAKYPAEKEQLAAVLKEIMAVVRRSV